MESLYDDDRHIREAVADGRHREVVGGRWDAIGKLQFDFLVSQGLKPEHRLLDVGCGALRGGVHFIRYLDFGRYYGVDINQSLLDAGFDVELAALGLQDRLPRGNLIRSGDFELDLPDGSFDFALAQSLFTHISFNTLRSCLEKIASKMRPGGVFFVTFFERPEGAPSSVPICHQPGNIVTHGAKDPYHYSFRDLQNAASESLWTCRYIGDWSHPMGQRMAAFTRRADDSPEQATRRLTGAEARLLPAGAEHYRAYVGPPDRFDFMSATQFSLLFANGLRDHHKVLDFGCGSLRLGRLLIPYLQAAGYYGIDPNTWLIDDAFTYELGSDIRRIKQPAFSSRDDFDCTVFEVQFDFIVAQSIVTHCGPDLFSRLLGTVQKALKPDGLFLFSIIRTDDANAPLPGPGWVYPECVPYTDQKVLEMAADVGLAACALPWHHPGATWYAAAADPARLPNEKERTLLTGAVLHDPQFQSSRAGLR